MTTTTAHIALGSNLGDRAAHIAAAVDALRQTPGVRVTAVSSLIETAAVGGPTDSPAYLNGAATVDTTLSAHDLLRAMQAIEIQLGRERAVRWGPRTVDLDLLLFGSASIDTPDLVVPHPLLHDRRFVLEPLAEIAPSAVHARSGRTVAQMLAALDRDAPG